MHFYQIFSSFFESLGHGNFLGKLKDRVNMSVNCVHHTVEEVLFHLDSAFDIPDKGVNSHVEWLYDGDFEEPDLILTPDSAVLLDEEDEEINLQTVQITKKQ